MGLELRQCTVCKERKEDSEFSRKAKTKNTGCCRTCTASRYKKYYRDNIEYNLNRVKVYYKKNIETKLLYSREYRSKNSEKCRDYNHKYLEKNRGVINERKRRYHSDNSSEIEARKKEWRKQNRDKVAAHSAVHSAIIRGKLKVEPCEVCGEKIAVGHHWSYAKKWRLSVIWLCNIHHGEAHRK